MVKTAHPPSRIGWSGIGSRVGGIGQSFLVVGVNAIKVVVFEQILDFFITQHEQILLHVLIYWILRNLVLIVIIVLFDAQWHIGGLNLFFQKFLPVNTCHPGVILYLLYPIATQSIIRVSEK